MKNTKKLFSLVILSAIVLLMFSGCDWLTCDQSSTTGWASTYSGANSECSSYCSDDPGCGSYTGDYNYYTGYYTCSCSE